MSIILLFHTFTHILIIIPNPPRIFLVSPHLLLNAFGLFLLIMIWQSLLVHLIFYCHCYHCVFANVCSAMLMLLILDFGFPKLTHAQLANSFLDLQGKGAAGYVCHLLIGAITEEFLSVSWLFIEGGVSDMSCPSLFLCSLATLVKFAKGKFPLPLSQVNTLGKILGLLKGAATVVCWSVSVSRSELIMNYRSASQLTVFVIISVTPVRSHIYFL